MDCGLPGSSVHGDSPVKNYWNGLLCCPPEGLPNSGINPGLLPCRQILYLWAIREGKINDESKDEGEVE